MRPISILLSHHRKEIQALIDTGSPADYISTAFAGWLQREGYESVPHVECVCSPLNNNACVCSENKILFYISKSNSSEEKIPLSAAVMPLNSYDLIIGYPTIEKYKLLDNLQAPIEASVTKPFNNRTTSDLVQETSTANTLEHTLLGAILNENLGSTLPHISELLEGSGNDGDDLTELFNSELPWDAADDRSDSSPDDLINQIEMHGSLAFQKKMRNICLRYKHCFSNSVRPQPAAVVPLKLDVNLDQWEVPRNSGPPRVQSDVKQEEIKKQIDKLLLLGVIQPSQSPYYSHPHLTPKPDGSWRFCIDYRQLNNASKSLGWPIPNIELLLRRVGKYNPQYFGKFDLTSGYHQTAMDKQSLSLTAFITAFGTYEWLRCPFGLKGAPSYFQRAMHTEVLSDLLYQICEVYLDDILFWGTSEEEYLQRLEILLKRLSEKNITINPKKCSLGLEQIEYTGHVLDKHGISFSQKKKVLVVNFRQPETQKDLKSFLGLANFFRNHIRNHSLLVHPLHEMLKNYKPRSKLLWTSETIQAFEQVKAAINACPKLYFLDDTSPVYLHTDASDYGVGAYLFQVVNGIEYPIMFLSQTFKAEQKRWSAADKECYAIVFAFKHLEHLIRDRYFILRTDHKNLTYLNLENSGKIRRWKLLIQEFNCGVEHIVGVLNFVADDFSRMIPANREEPVTEVNTSSVVTFPVDVDLSNSAADGPIEMVIDDVPTPGLPVSTSNSASVLDVMATLTNEDNRVPRDKYKLISSVHNSVVGHMGVDKTYDRLVAQGHKWTQMRNHISIFITKHCPCCQKLAVNKIINNTQPFTLSSYDIMQRVACDSTGRLPKDANGNEYLISIIDHFSRFIEIYPVKDLTAKEFAKCLLQWIGRYGAPKELVSDKGTQFCNEVIAELCKMVGTSQVFTMTASKQENGIVERSIKEIRRHLRAIIFTTNLMDNWSTYLPLVQRILNADVKEALGVSPSQILFGNSIQLDRGILLPNMPNQSFTLSDWMNKMLQAQSEILHIARKTLEARDDFHMSKHHGNPTTYPVNSYVLVDYINQPPTTLHTNLEGPFRVVSSANGQYTLQNLVTEELNEYHVSRLRPFYYDDEDTPRQTANRDSQQWDVDSIIDHAGDQNHRKELLFRVRWLGHDEACDTWEPYSNLRHNIKLHDYLKANKMKKLIPKYNA